MEPIVICSAGERLLFGVELLESVYIISEILDSLGQSRDVDGNYGVNVR